MQRREFIKTIAGSAVVWPLAARAQQPVMPIIGFLSQQEAGKRPIKSRKQVPSLVC